MSKICGNCGTQLDDQSVFCTTCGTPYQAPQPVPQPEQPVEAPAPQPVRTRKPAKAGGLQGLLKNKKLLAIAAAALVATVTLIVILCVTLSSSTEDALDNFVSASTGDVGAMEDCIPECLYENGVLSQDTVDKNSETVSAALAAQMAGEYGADVEITYEITKEAELPESMVRQIAQGLSLRYKIDPQLVESGYMLQMETEISGSNLIAWEDDTVYVVEIDGDWFFIGNDYTEPTLLVVEAFSQFTFFRF